MNNAVPLSEEYLDALRSGINGKSTAFVSLLLVAFDELCDAETLEANIAAILEANAGGAADVNAVIPMAVQFRTCARSFAALPPEYSQAELEDANALLKTLGYTIDLVTIYANVISRIHFAKEGVVLRDLVNNGDTPEDLIAPYPDEAPEGKIRETWLARVKEAGRDDIVAWHDDVMARHDDGDAIITMILTHSEWE